MPTFRIDVYAWIPQPDVPNPINSLPGGVARWGPGACGPFFGGDNFINPPSSPSAWSGTFRAMQTLAFSATTFGAQPVTTMNAGVVPGTTTVLTATRAEGGKVCHSLTAKVKTSRASVSWGASDNWYQATMHGEAQDPVPADVGARAGGAIGTGVGGLSNPVAGAFGGVYGSAAGSAVASALTPNLEWDLTIRFQRGTVIPWMTRADYAIHVAGNMDVSATKIAAPFNFGGSANLVHGLIKVRRFPSYVAYVTIANSGSAVTIPLYFADASARNLGEIAIGWTDPIRQLTW